MKYTRRPPSREGLSHATWFCRAKKEPGMTCESAVLSEDMLKRVCAKVLGLEAFDENEFANRVRRITVAPDGSLDFDLLNGESAHWRNRHIEDKIRQQLQVLRDNGYLIFEGRGMYRRV